MSPHQRPILAILDSSAIQSYGHGHVHVGEILGEVGEEEAQVGIPAVALLDAHASLAGDRLGRARLRVLPALPTTTMIGLDHQAASAVAEVVPFTGNDLAQAHAAWAAVEHAALLLTTEPLKASTAVAKDRILTIPTEDA